MKDGETEGQSSAMSFGYVGGPDLGHYCLIDVNRVAVHDPDCEYVNETLELLPDREYVLLAVQKKSNKSRTGRCVQSL